MGVLKKRADEAAAAELAVSVASYALGVPIQAIVDEERGSAEAAFARHLAMYLCYTGLELSLSRVAVAFGRDRSTVARACHEMEDRREEGQFDLWISALEAMLQEAPPPASVKERQP